MVPPRFSCSGNACSRYAVSANKRGNSWQFEIALGEIFLNLRTSHPEGLGTSEHLDLECWHHGRALVYWQPWPAPCSHPSKVEESRGRRLFADIPKVRESAFCQAVPRSRKSALCEAVMGHVLSCHSAQGFGEVTTREGIFGSTYAGSPRP